MAKRWRQLPPPLNPPSGLNRPIWPSPTLVARKCTQRGFVDNADGPTATVEWRGDDNTATDTKSHMTVWPGDVVIDQRAHRRIAIGTNHTSGQNALVMVPGSVKATSGQAVGKGCKAITPAGPLSAVWLVRLADLTGSPAKRLQSLKAARISPWRG